MKKVWTWITTATIGCIAAFSFSGCGAIRYDKYADAAEYKVGGATYATTQVKEVEIDWVGGNIEIEQASSADTVHVVEDNASEKQEERMHYYLDGDILKIKYCAAGLRGNISEQYKNLRVAIPAGVALEVESVSAVITIGVIDVTDFSLENVSGVITVEQITCNDATFETVSGKITVGALNVTRELSLETVSGAFFVTNLSASFLEADTVSGNVTLGLYKAISGEIDSTSGNVTFVLGNGMGATLRYETNSGEFSCPNLQFNKNTGTMYEIIGNGTNCNLTVESISGNLTVQSETAN